MRSSFMRRSEGRVGDAGRTSEKRLAKKVGGRLTPASGAVEHAKGDIRLPGWLMEAKSTVHGSISLKLDWLLKIRREAAARGSRPALAVTFTDPAGKAVPGGEWVLVPLAEWKAASEK